MKNLKDIQVKNQLVALIVNDFLAGKIKLSDNQHNFLRVLKKQTVIRPYDLIFIGNIMSCSYGF